MTSSTKGANDYPAHYLNRLFQEASIEPPDLTRLDGFSESFRELYDIHQKGGPDAVQTVWPVLVKARPELNALRQEPSRPLLIHASKLGSLRPLEWLVPGEIPARGLTVLFGPSGAGKSFVALNYALMVAQDKTVVYIAAEGETGYEDRVKAWLAHNNKGCGNLYFYTESLAMLDNQAVFGFIDTVRDQNPDLIVIDTLARCLLGGDENSSKDMGLFIESCAIMQRELKSAVLVVHHTGKKGASERGSSALRAGCDSMIELKNDDEVITLVSSKSKDARPFEKRHLQRLEIKLDEGRTSCVVVPSTRRIDIKDGNLTPTQRSVLETLNLETFVAAGAKSTAIRDVIEIAPSTLYSTLSNLLKAKYIRQAKKGDPYFITATGKKLVEESE